MLKNLMLDDIEVYIGSFTIDATLRELYNLERDSEILMVDLPLDIIAKLKNGNKIKITIIRWSFVEELWLERKNNYCKTIKM